MHILELQIFQHNIGKNCRGQGIGRIFLENLAEEAKKEGFYKLVLNVISKNTKALEFYEGLDYFLVGVYKDQGILNGEWVDAVITEKFLIEK